jgi:hypothetical protein
MQWPLIIAVAWIAVGGGLTLIGVRLVASNLSQRTPATPVPGLSARPLVLGLVCAAIGGIMLLNSERLVDMLGGGGPGATP